jgi:K+-sensing histidine kinase KdpD
MLCGMASALTPLFDAVPDLAGILLAALSLAVFFLPEEMDKLKNHRKTRVATACVLICMGIGGVISNAVQRARNKAEAEQSKIEAKHQTDRLNDDLGWSRRIQESLQSKVDELHGQLTAYGVVLGTMSKNGTLSTSALNEMAHVFEKTAEHAADQATLSNKQLSTRLLDVANRMRQLELQYTNQAAQVEASYRQQLMSSPDKSQQLWEANIAASQQLHAALQFQYALLQGEALYLRDEILLRLPPQPRTQQAQFFESGTASGASPLYENATYLEKIARKLSP